MGFIESPLLGASRGHANPARRLSRGGSTETSGTTRMSEFDEADASNAYDDLPQDVIEVGNAAIWSLSTCKPNFGVEQLRDDDFDSFWQYVTNTRRLTLGRSEGPQPHIVNIQFSKKQTISVRYMLRLTLKYVGLYLDYTADESYTPQVIAVKAGTCHADLQEFCITNVEEPVGWVYISLHLDPERRKPLRTHLVQIVILKNHQLGKDTHIRQIKIFAPRPYVLFQR